MLMFFWFICIVLTYPHLVTYQITKTISSMKGQLFPYYKCESISSMVPRLVILYGKPQYKAS